MPIPIILNIQCQILKFSNSYSQISAFLKEYSWIELREREQCYVGFDLASHVWLSAWLLLLERREVQLGSWACATLCCSMTSWCSSSCSSTGERNSCSWRGSGLFIQQRSEEVGKYTLRVGSRCWVHGHLLYTHTYHAINVYHAAHKTKSCFMKKIQSVQWQS